MFFAQTQNKLLYAVTRKTAAEIIVSRADENAPNMGLMTWKGSIVRKGDIIVAKNYLDAAEIDKLNRLTALFLDSAEQRVSERKDLTLDFWRENVTALLSFQGQEILSGNGSVSNSEMERRVGEVYAKFDARRKRYEAELSDAEDLALLQGLEAEVRNRN